MLRHFSPSSCIGLRFSSEEAARGRGQPAPTAGVCLTVGSSHQHVRCCRDGAQRVEREMMGRGKQQKKPGEDEGIGTGSNASAPALTCSGGAPGAAGTDKSGISMARLSLRGSYPCVSHGRDLKAQQ